MQQYLYVVCIYNTTDAKHAVDITVLSVEVLWVLRGYSKSTWISKWHFQTPTLPCHFATLYPILMPFFIHWKVTHYRINEKRALSYRCLLFTYIHTYINKPIWQNGGIIVLWIWQYSSLRHMDSLLDVLYCCSLWYYLTEEQNLSCRKNWHNKIFSEWHHFLADAPSFLSVTFHNIFRQPSFFLIIWHTFWMAPKILEQCFLNISHSCTGLDLTKPLIFKRHKALHLTTFIEL